MMLAFVALFTIFVGLVGLLAAIGECQKRRRASGKLTDNKTASKDSRDQVKDWLAERQLAVPSQKQIITLLNKSFQLFSFQEWKDIKLEMEEFPNIELSSVSYPDNNSIQFLCTLENFPLVSVSCESELLGRVLCELQVEWLFALVQVTLVKENEHILVCVEHKEPVRMSLGCSVQGDIEDRERVASSVADELQMWFESLAINNALLSNDPIPSVLVSDHDNEISEEGQMTNSLDELSQHSSTPEEALCVVTAVEHRPTDSPSNCSHEEKTAAEEQEEIEVKVQLKDVSMSGERGETANGRLERDNVGRPQPLMAVVEEEEEGGKETPQRDEELPLSPSWRRSPSYEQLQQIELDPQRLLQTFNKSNHSGSPRIAGSDRRALTLSVSGSEAESVYGADERIPSTLVYEVADSTDKLRHIVAMTPAHAVKLRRRYPQATKLHVYNDHCFTAAHIKKRIECNVCGSKIAGLFGKQAYICQDCKMVVHKHCHFKVDGQCLESKLHQMNLIYPDNTSTASAN